MTKRQRMDVIRPKQSVLAVAVAASLATVCPATSFAQEDDSLDEIIVTATRRAQALQDIPYNITAVTSNALKQQGVNDLSELTRMIPGLSFYDRGPKGNSASSRLILRGISVDNSLISDFRHVTAPTVATYIDETPLFTNLQLTDIERVEVVRGPQVTLFGSSSMGGTVRFIHNQPSTDGFDVSLSADVSQTAKAGDPNYGFDGVFNIPVSEKAAIRVSGGHSFGAGFIDQPAAFDVGSDLIATPVDPSDPFGSEPVTVSKKDTNEAEISHVRAALLVEPSDDTSFGLSYMFQQTDARGRQGHTPNAPGFSDYEQGLFFVEDYDQDVNLAALNFSHDFGSFEMSLDASTFENEMVFVSDSTGFLINGSFFPAERFTPRTISDATNSIKDEGTALEGRIVGSAGEGKLDYVLGLFYQNLETSDEDVEIARAYNEGGVLASDLYFGLSLFTEFEDKAIFGDFTYHASEKWQLSAGFRYFKQDFEALQNFILGPANGFTIPYEGDLLKNSESDTLFRLNAAYDVSDETMLYFTVSEGFRRGGANSVPEAEPSEFRSYKSDSVTNYEVGLKGTMGNARYSAAAYFVDWDNVQVGTLTPVLFFTAAVNAEEAESKGIEFQVEGEASDGLTYSLGYSYTSAELSEDFSIASISGSAGSTLPGTPEHLVTAALTYDMQLSRGRSLVWGIDGSYSSSVVNTIETESSNFRKFDGFEVLNANITYQLNDDWRIRVFGTNLTDSLGVTAARTAVHGPLHRTDWIIRPRTFGLQFSYEPN